MVQTYRRGKMFLWHLRNARLPRRSIYSSRRGASPRRQNNNRAEERTPFGAPSRTQSQMNADVCVASRRHSSSNVAFNARSARAAAAGWRALLKRRGRQKRERHLLSSRQGGAWNFLAFQTQSITHPSSKVLAAGDYIKLLRHVEKFRILPKSAPLFVAWQQSLTGPVYPFTESWCLCRFFIHVWQKSEFMTGGSVGAGVDLLCCWQRVLFGVKFLPSPGIFTCVAVPAYVSGSQLVVVWFHPVTDSFNERRQSRTWHPHLNPLIVVWI